MTSAISRPVYIYNSQMTASTAPREPDHFATSEACYTAMVTGLKEYGVRTSNIITLRSKEEFIKVCGSTENPISVILPGGSTFGLIESLDMYCPPMQESLKKTHLLGICAGSHVIALTNGVLTSTHPHFKAGRHNPKTDSKAVVINIQNKEEFPTLGDKISQYLSYWNGGLSFCDTDYHPTSKYVFLEKGRYLRQGDTASFVSENRDVTHIGVSFHPEIPFTCGEGYDSTQIPLGMDETTNTLANRAILFDLFSRIHIEGNPEIRKELARNLEERSMQCTKAPFSSIPPIANPS